MHSGKRETSQTGLMTRFRESNAVRPCPTNACFVLPVAIEPTTAGSSMKFATAILGFSLICVSASAEPVPEPGSVPHFVNMISGRWDNLVQVEAGRAAKADKAHQHLRYAMNYVPMQPPGLRGVLIAIESYGTEGFDGEMSRVALHRFRDEGDGIVHEFIFPHDRSKLGDLTKDLSPLMALTEGGVRINVGCRLYWHWAGDHYEGATRKGQCKTSSYTETEILVEGKGWLYSDRLIRHDRNYELNGSEITRDGGATPEVFNRLH